MKEHFKYGLNMVTGRPILSTRHLYQTQLQQKMLEQKVLETLSSQGEADKYKEFVHA